MQEQSEIMRPFDPLTDRERQVVRLILDGLETAAIATRMNIATGTVKTYLRNIFVKYGITRRYELIVANSVGGRGISLDTADEAYEKSRASKVDAQHVDDGNNGDY